MFRLLVVFVALCLAGIAFAAQNAVSDKFDPGPKGPAIDPDPQGPREGGDTIANATVISYLPYSDNGTTSGYSNDYQPATCGSYSWAPDVVYSYTPSGDGSICVRLCGSSFDTIVYIYAGVPGNEVACNDDFCDLQSQVEFVQVTGGVTYYIVVDGYNTSSGNYILNLYGCHVEPYGACCHPDGSCTADWYYLCDDTYMGDGTTCTPSPCPGPTGACCHPDGTCSVGTQSQCTDVYQGDGTICVPNPCAATPTAKMTWGEIKSLYSE